MIGRMIGGILDSARRIWEIPGPTALVREQYKKREAARIQKSTAPIISRMSGEIKSLTERFQSRASRTEEQISPHDITGHIPRGEENRLREYLAAHPLQEMMLTKEEELYSDPRILNN